MDQTCVYIPSYFDFVRIRNHLKKEEVEFVAMSELVSVPYIIDIPFIHSLLSPFLPLLPPSPPLSLPPSDTLDPLHCPGLALSSPLATKDYC